MTEPLTHPHGDAKISSWSDPMPKRTRPQFRWPSERHLTPTHCENCGGVLIANDVPTASFPVTDIACWQCSHEACELIHDSVRRRPTMAELAAMLVPSKRGRRPQDRSSESLPERIAALLADGSAWTGVQLCDELSISIATCRNSVRTARDRGHPIVSRGGRYSLLASAAGDIPRGPGPDPDAAPARVVQALSDGAAMTSAELCAALDIAPPSTLRVAIAVARKRGCHIVSRGGRYKIEERRKP